MTTSLDATAPRATASSAFQPPMWLLATLMIASWSIRDWDALSLLRLPDWANPDRDCRRHWRSHRHHGRAPVAGLSPEFL